MDEPPDAAFGRFAIRTFAVSALAGAVVAGALAAPVLMSSPTSWVVVVVACFGAGWAGDLVRRVTSRKLYERSELAQRAVAPRLGHDTQPRHR